MGNIPSPRKRPPPPLAEPVQESPPLGDSFCERFPRSCEPPQAVSVRSASPPIQLTATSTESLADGSSTGDSASDLASSGRIRRRVPTTIRLSPGTRDSPFWQTALA